MTRFPNILRRKAEIEVPEIRMTERVWRSYKATIAQKPPETFALLGGSLDDPFLISEYRFCPPARDQFGRVDASAVHVNVDADFMNFIIDEEWKPQGLYMLGVWHSHPPGCYEPSIGDPSRNEGDVTFFSTCLENDDSPDGNWNHFLAPITTFSRQGSDDVHCWILSKGEREPQKVGFRVEGNSSKDTRLTRAKHDLPLLEDWRLAESYLTSEHKSGAAPAQAGIMKDRIDRAAREWSRIASTIIGKAKPAQDERLPSVDSLNQALDR